MRKTRRDLNKQVSAIILVIAHIMPADYISRLSISFYFQLSSAVWQIMFFKYVISYFLYIYKTLSLALGVTECPAKKILFT